MVVGLLIALSILGMLLPSLFASNLAVVLSASMAPGMPVGALALVVAVKPTEVRVGDIVAFSPPWDQDVTVSHRVIEVIDEPELSFVTRGDANEEPDVVPIPAASISGKVLFDIPMVGYGLYQLGLHARSRLGFALLVCLPSLVLFGSAVRDVKLAASPGRGRARWEQKRKEREKKRTGFWLKRKEPRTRRRGQHSWLAAW